MSNRFNLASAFALAVCFIANSASAQILLFDDFDASTNPTGLATVNGGTSDIGGAIWNADATIGCLLYTSPSPRDKRQSRMPSSA